jgi:hypothetical protein
MKASNIKLVATKLGMVGIIFTGCAEEKPVLPEGVKCSSIREVSGAEQLSSALADAKDGDCVLIRGGIYEGNFNTSGGVKLIGEYGKEVNISGVLIDEPAISFNGGSGGGLWWVNISGNGRGVTFSELSNVKLSGVRVSSTNGIGVLILNSQILAKDVSINSCKGAGFVVYCESKCENKTLIESPLIKDNDIGGLYVRNAVVEIVGGTVSGSIYKSKAGEGWGIAIVDGSEVDVKGTIVSDNTGVGIIINNAITTKISDVKVTGNGDRGIWIQNVSGSFEAAEVSSVFIDGETIINENKRTGLGLYNSQGIIINNAIVTSTISIPTGVDGQTVYIGDGLGIFEGSGNLKVNNILLQDNARAQIIADSAVGQIIINGTISGTTGEWGVVIQNSEGAQFDTQGMEIPEHLSRQPEGLLPIDAPEIMVDVGL